jgi:hypothetical protein
MIYTIVGVPFRHSLDIEGLQSCEQTFANEDSRIFGFETQVKVGLQNRIQEMELNQQSSPIQLLHPESKISSYVLLYDSKRR